jgi:dipeptidyl aminopeptidase/acylaminoacyl peptidase
MDVYVKPVVGPGSEELLVAIEGASDVPSDWSPDGQFLLYSTGDKDIWALPMWGDRKPFPVVQAPFDELNGQFSPDGRWIAYQSNESGRFEIYVQRFPGPGPKTPVSSGGGDQVRWRKDGKELFYLAPDNGLMAVPIRLDESGDRAEVGAPALLFSPSLSGSPRYSTARHYMASPDGQRFLMDTLKEVTLPITVVMNWNPKP